MNAEHLFSTSSSISSIGGEISWALSKLQKTLKLPDEDKDDFDFSKQNKN